MKLAIPNELRDAPAPAWSEATRDGSVGVDFLGTRQVGLDMLSDLTQGFNNVVESAREHMVIAWTAWRFQQTWREAARDPSASDWRLLHEAVESIQLAGHVHLSEELGRDNIGRGAGSAAAVHVDDDQIYLRFDDYSRGDSTSAMAAVNYGPSAKGTRDRDSGRLQNGLDLILGTDGVWVPTEDRGRRLALLLDARLRGSPAYGIFARQKLPASLPLVDALDLARRGLSYGPASMDRSERVDYTRFLFDLDRPGDPPHSTLRRETLATLLVLVRVLSDPEEGGPDDMAVRRVLTGGRWPVAGGTWPDQLQDVAVRWRVFQLRQVQRYCLESFLYLAEAWMDGLPTSQAICDEICRHLPDGLPDMPTARAWGEVAPSGDLAGWASDPWEGGPWGVIWGEIHPLLRGRDARPEAACEPITRLTLTTVPLYDALVPSIGPGAEYAALGGRQRIGLSVWRGWWDRCAARPLRETVAELVGELVLQQHVAVAVQRFDGEARRLRFCNDERGWAALPGTEAATPGPTPDRIATLLALLADLALVEADGQGGFLLAPAGSDLLAELGL